LYRVENIRISSPSFEISVFDQVASTASIFSTCTAFSWTFLKPFPQGTSCQTSFWTQSSRSFALSTIVFVPTGAPAPSPAPAGLRRSNFRIQTASGIIPRLPSWTALFVRGSYMITRFPSFGGGRDRLPLRGTRTLNPRSVRSS
jgi:hypothetical protein